MPASATALTVLAASPPSGPSFNDGADGDLMLCPFKAKRFVTR